MCTLNNRGPTWRIACTTSVPARAVWPASMQQPMRGSILLDRLQYIQGRRPQLVLGPMIVDCDTDVVFLYEFFYSRQSLRCGIAGDDDGNTRSLAVFELGPDVGVFILGEIDGTGSVQPDARRGIIRQRCGFLLRVGRKMIFDVLGIQLEHIQLLHEADSLRASEVAEGVTGQAQANGRRLVQPMAGPRPSRRRCLKQQTLRHRPRRSQ